MNKNLKTSVYIAIFINTMFSAQFLVRFLVRSYFRICSKYHECKLSYFYDGRHLNGKVVRPLPVPTEDREIEFQCKISAYC